MPGHVGVYRVRMNFKAVDHDTGEVIMDLPNYAIEVQPPPHCVDDPQMLDLHLEHLAKVKKLVSLRKSIEENNQYFEPLFDRDFTVEGDMLSHSTRIE